MIVVADTAPLNYLALIDELRLLPILYDEVLIPEAVWREMQHGNAPSEIKDFLLTNPIWLKVSQVSNVIDIKLGILDAGEREAIQLAQEVNAEIILIDEKDGRRIATERNLTTVGTLGILDAAAAIGLVDLTIAFDKLQKTNFRAPSQLMQRILDNDAKRRDDANQI